jgi:hypothetical protein
VARGARVADASACPRPQAPDGVPVGVIDAETALTTSSGAALKVGAMESGMTESEISSLDLPGGGTRSRSRMGSAAGTVIPGRWGHVRPSGTTRPFGKIKIFISNGPVLRPSSPLTATPGRPLAAKRPPRERSSQVTRATADST